VILSIPRALPWVPSWAAPPRLASPRLPQGAAERGAGSLISVFQAAARPFEVDDWRKMMATAEASTRRSAPVSRTAAQLVIGEHHIYDF
jgi:hypothetical protein